MLDCCNRKSQNERKAKLLQSEITYNTQLVIVLIYRLRKNLQLDVWVSSDVMMIIVIPKEITNGRMTVVIMLLLTRCDTILFKVILKVIHLDFRNMAGSSPS